MDNIYNICTKYVFIMHGISYTVYYHWAKLAIQVQIIHVSSVNVNLG